MWLFTKPNTVVSSVRLITGYTDSEGYSDEAQCQYKVQDQVN